MALDFGWPPFCVGVDLPPPELPANWQEQLLQAVTGPTTDDRPDPELGVLKVSRSPTHEVEGLPYCGCRGDGGLRTASAATAATAVRNGHVPRWQWL